MIVVTKFGGSSLSTPNQFKKVKDIIYSDSKRRIVVVSALGKRDSEDTKITDLLYILHAHLKYSVPYDDIWKMIYERYILIKNTLNIDFDIESELQDIYDGLSKNSDIDFLVSRGEYLTAKLMAAYLNFKFIDAQDVIKFSFDGRINEDETYALIRGIFVNSDRIVVPGFYGSYPNSVIHLFSRGGSDITGSLLAKAVNASMYENWTDVSGVLAADPRIVENPRPIRYVTYAELRELSYMGASVLHEETIFPVRQSNIPINIKNTNNPSDPGTIIQEVCNDNSYLITGIAGKRDFVSINITKSHMSNEVGFLRKTLSIFEKYNVSIEHIPSGIDSFSVVVANTQIAKCEYELVSEIKAILNPDEVKIEKNVALIAIVGRNMAKKSGICARVFNILGERKINIKMLAQGPSELNIIIGIDNNNYNESIKALYKDLIE